MSMLAKTPIVRSMKSSYAVLIELSIGTDIEQTASSIVGTRDKRMAIREELNRIDIGFVSGKGLDGLASSNIPELRKRIAGTRDEGVLVGGIDADAHDVAQMVGKLGDLGSRLDIPLHARHIT